MSKKGFSKIVFLSLVLVTLVMPLGNQVFGAPKPVIQSLQIQSVNVDYTNSSIHIYGQNFGNGTTPVVTIGGNNVTVTSYVSDEIVAEIPASTVAGDYLLVVSTGGAAAQNDKYDLTIGVPGPIGVNCAVGQVLAQTVSGWQCRSLAVFQNAVGTCGSEGCDLTCSYGWGNCDSNYTNGCETGLLNDQGNCGSCGNVCPSGQGCLAGVCGIWCPPWLTNCSGVCKDLSNDPLNCGSCGNVCPSGICSSSVCGISCSPIPSSEICNNIDDDCNGVVDDVPGIGTACTGAGIITTGACKAEWFCRGGAPGPGPLGLTCQQTVFPTAEVCNGIDDDCDGQIDEGDPGGGAICNTGLPSICASGTMHCVGGTISCLQNQSPQLEICNGIDDNCDGQTDEGDPGGGATCNTGLPGICASGTTHCVGGTISCLQNQSPQLEICNGIDDNCDGLIDEGFNLTVDPNNCGSCGNVCPSGQVCMSGVCGIQSSCVPNSTRLCYGGPPGTNNIGECRTGTETCNAEGTGYGPCVGEVLPAQEVCGDGLDNDCDGSIDEECLAYTHTITMDGINDFAMGTEKFSTSSTGYTAYISWDASNLFLGMEASELAVADPNKLLLIYVGGTPGTMVGINYNSQQPTLAFPAKFHFNWRLGEGAMSKVIWNGTSWVPTGESATAFRNGTYVEFVIPLTSIDSPTTSLKCHLNLVNTVSPPWSYAAVPASSFSDTYDPDYQRYFDFNLTSVAAPNSYIPHF